MLNVCFYETLQYLLEKNIVKYKNDRYKWRYSKQWPSINKRSFLHRFGLFLAYICCHIRVSNFPPEYFPAEIIINGKNSGGKDFCRKSFQANFFLGISGFRRRISGSNGFKSNVVNQALLSLHGSNLRLHSPFKLKGSFREKWKGV